MSLSALLPVDSQRELNDPRFVRLPGQILQSGRGVGIDIVGMVERVKEIGREPDVGNFFEFEVLEYRDVGVPCTGANQIRPSARIEKITADGVEARVVREMNSQPVGLITTVAVGPKRAYYSLAAIGRDQGFQVSPGHIGGLRGIKIPPKPQTLGPVVEGQFHALVRIKCGISRLKLVAGNATPESTPPVTDGCHLPATNHTVEEPVSVTCDFFTLAERKIDDAVESDVMRRHSG